MNQQAALYMGICGIKNWKLLMGLKDKSYDEAIETLQAMQMGLDGESDADKIFDGIQRDEKALGWRESEIAGE
jgi:hypothetical protein